MIRFVSMLLLLAACGRSESPAPAAEAPAAETPAPETPAPEAPAVAEAEAPPEEAAEDIRYPHLFGDALDTEREPVALSALLAAPGEYADQVVKTSGTIQQVCQSMGCWMELRAGEEGAQAIRVPMANHAFFLPKDVAGRSCTIEGKVSVRDLTDEEREHYASEGATVLAQVAQIDATGVMID
ncbi:MAG: DUF4920 domain-containing protein [Myxococcota bacterium]